MKGRKGGQMVTLREARTSRLLTMRELAEQAGVALSTLYLIENGRSVPSFRVIRALSAALGMQPADIAEFASAVEEARQGKAAAA